MIEKIKYHPLKAVALRRVRISCIAVMTAFTIAVVTLLSCSINTVKIFDGEKTYTVRTLNGNVSSVLANLTLKSDCYNILSTTVKGAFTTVEIEYTFPVYITQGENTSEIEFSVGTVLDALTLAGFTPDEYDFVEPSLDTDIKDTIYIDYTNVDYVDGSYTEPIPHTVDTIYSQNQESGTITVKDGTDGLQLVTYTDKLVNGTPVEKTITGISVLADAISGKQIVGTKAVTAAVTTSASVNCISTLTPSSPVELDGNGVPVNYTSKMTVRATAYTYTGKNCATGVAPQPGYIAVNPKVIPYGTKMYIKSSDGKYIYGYAVAADTGGYVSWAPNGVDLFMSTKSQCTNFGVRNVEIYIIG